MGGNQNGTAKNDEWSCKSGKKLQRRGTKTWDRGEKFDLGEKRNYYPTQVERGVRSGLQDAHRGGLSGEKIQEDSGEKILLGTRRKIRNGTKGIIVERLLNPYNNGGPRRYRKKIGEWKN